MGNENNEAKWDAGDTNGLNVRKEKWDFGDHFTHGNIIRWSICCNLVNSVETIDKNQVKILDIGSGYSTFYNFFKYHFSSYGRKRINYTGLEFLQQQIDFVMDKFKDVSKVNSFNVLQCDLYKNMPSEIVNDKYDVIFAQEIIEHIDIKTGSNLLQDIRGLLKDTGVLVISSPNPKKHKGQQFIFPEYHVYEYTYDEMHALLAETGFVVRNEFGISSYLNDVKTGLTAEEKMRLEHLRLVSDAYARAAFVIDKPKQAQCYLMICEKSNEINRLLD